MSRGRSRPSSPSSGCRTVAASDPRQHASGGSNPTVPVQTRSQTQSLIETQARVLESPIASTFNLPSNYSYYYYYSFISSIISRSDNTRSAHTNYHHTALQTVQCELRAYTRNTVKRRQECLDHSDTRPRPWLVVGSLVRLPAQAPRGRPRL